MEQSEEFITVKVRAADFSKLRHIIESYEKNRNMEMYQGFKMSCEAKARLSRRFVLTDAVDGYARLTHDPPSPIKPTALVSEVKIERISKPQPAMLRRQYTTPSNLH